MSVWFLASPLSYVQSFEHVQNSYRSLPEWSFRYNSYVSVLIVFHPVAMHYVSILCFFPLTAFEVVADKTDVYQRRSIVFKTGNRLNHVRNGRWTDNKRKHFWYINTVISGHFSATHNIRMASTAPNKTAPHSSHLYAEVQLQHTNLDLHDLLVRRRMRRLWCRACAVWSVWPTDGGAPCWGLSRIHQLHADASTDVWWATPSCWSTHHQSAHITNQYTPWARPEASHNTSALGTWCQVHEHAMWVAGSSQHHLHSSPRGNYFSIFCVKNM